MIYGGRLMRIELLDVERFERRLQGRMERMPGRGMLRGTRGHWKPKIDLSQL